MKRVKIAYFFSYRSPNTHLKSRTMLAWEDAACPTWGIGEAARFFGPDLRR